MRHFVPRRWQPPMIDFGLRTRRCNLLARPGMGKSSATLAIADTCLLAGEAEHPLVVAPLRVARSTWREEGGKWSEFAHLKIEAIVGTESQRLAALRNDKAHIHTVNFEVLPWLIEQIGVEHWPFDMVIADEAGRLRSFRLRQGGKRAQALAAIAHTKVRRWINLSGTIVPKGLINWWAPMWFIDKGRRLGSSFDAFENRWFGYQRVKDAVHAHQTHVDRIAFPHAFDEITEAVRDVSLAFNPKDWFDIKDPIVVPVYVDLPAEAKKRYREMEREMFTHVGGHDIEAFAASGKVIKCLAEGTEVLTDRGWTVIESVTSQDQVWDGVEWVSTHGSVLNGYTSVVECWGVEMTSDHKVMTTSGWAEAREINDGEPTKRHDRAHVRLPNGFETTRFNTETEQHDSESDMGVPLRMRQASYSCGRRTEIQQPRTEEVLRLSARRNATRRMGYARDDKTPRVANVDATAPTMLKADQQGLAQLWWARNQSVQAMAGLVQKLLGRHGTDLEVRSNHRATEGERQLHSRQLLLGLGGRAVEQQTPHDQGEHTGGRDDAQQSGEEIRFKRYHSSPAGDAWVAGQRPVPKARNTAAVYDIVNAGPRNRFTVRGSAGNLLVHNCMQLANGAIYTGADEQVERDVSHWVPAHDEKLDALESIIEENDGEVIMAAYHFKPDLVRLKKRFPKGRHITTKADEDAFKRGEIQLAFVHPQSIGHGVDGFQNVCHIVAFFAITFDLDQNDQLIERVGPMRQAQIGADREVMVYQILARGTIDEIMAARLIKKRGVLDATMDSLAYKPEMELA